MSPTELEIDQANVQTLVLARLTVKQKKPLTRAQIAKDVRAAISPPFEATLAERAATDALAACEQAGQIGTEQAAKTKSKSKANFKANSKTKTKPAGTVLTPAGKQALLDKLKLKALPAIKNWEGAQQLIALSAIGAGDAAKRVLNADQLAAHVLVARHQLPATTRNITEAVDHIAWRAIGVDSAAPFTAAAVQRHLLRQIVPADVRVDAKKWRRLLAMRAIDGAGYDAKALTRALLQQTLRPARVDSAREPTAVIRRGAGTAQRETAVVVRNDNSPVHALQPSLADFARAVSEAARGPGVSRFHDDRAFIGSVWEQMRGRKPIADMSLADFKLKLIAAHREGLLRITRADLVAAMDPREVQRSEARYQDATFHFVALDAGGVR